MEPEEFSTMEEFHRMMEWLKDHPKSRVVFMVGDNFATLSFTYEEDGTKERFIFSGDYS